LNMANKRGVVEATDTLVVGGGIMGVSVAYFLAARGVDVSVLDRGPLGARASGANPGSLSVQNKPMELVGLSIKGVNLWKDLSERHPLLGYKRLGGLRLAETETELEKLLRVVEDQEASGLKVTHLTAEEVQKEAPYLSNHILGANYCALDGKSDSRQAVRVLSTESDSQYARFYPYHEVIKVQAGTTGYEVHAVHKGEPKTFIADRVVLAAGVSSPAVAKWFDLRIEMRVRNNQVMVTAPTDVPIRHMITHAGGHLTTKQSDNGTVLIGGGWPGKLSPITESALPNHESTVGLAHLAHRVIPGLRPHRVVRVWAEVDGRTSNQCPVFGPIPGYEGAYITTSCFGGYVLGPLLGKSLAEVIIDGNVPADVLPFCCQ